LAAIAAAALSWAAPVSADDWPQWQGPNRNAMSKETGLLQQWPEGGPRLAWKAAKLGGGDSAPSVAAGRIFGMSNRGKDEVVWALSEKEGKELWVTKLGPAFEQRVPQSKEGPGCTPTVNGDRLYVLGVGGTLACLQVKDGKELWRRDFATDFGGRAPMWNFRESPLVDGDKVVCTPGGEEATLVALNKLTGETIWKSRVPEPPGGGAAQPGNRGGFGDFSLMQADPVLSALDADKSKEISAEELDGAAAALAKLDKNSDSMLGEDEVAPAFGGRGPGGPGAPGGRPAGEQPRPAFSVMRFMKANAALDADESGEISAAELKDAAAALKKLDGNNDGKLTEDEVRPQFGGPGAPGGQGGSGGQGGRGRGGFGGFGGAGSSAAYASTIAIDFGGQRQYVQLTAKSLVGVSASDGNVLWQYAKPANRMGINISTPIYLDGQVFATSAYGAGGGLAKLTKDGDGIKAEEVWFSGDMENHHGGVIAYKGALYGANGGNGGGYLVCLDQKTGELLWRDRKAPKGSIAFADGRLYYRTEDSGELLLIEPSRERLIERGRFEQPDRTSLPAWAHPVIANGKLYVRDQDTLFCYDITAK
jgi:outer membrane protein assembly factor BamB